MAIEPFGEWLPDQPDFANPGARVIKNVIPLTKTSYGPMPTPQVYSGALTARCQGCYAYLDDSQGVHIFAGDATKLYQLTAGSAPNFSNISRAAGGAYTTGSPLHPAIPLAPSWSMTSYGNRIIAANYSDDLQTFLVGTDTLFSQLAAAAPKARFVATIRDFVMVGNTSDAVNGAQPRRVWWPAIANPLSWPTPGTNAAIQVQSDYQDLQQSDLGEVTGLIGGHLTSADGLVFCQRGVYRVMYAGSADGIFSFQVAEGASGTNSPLSIVLRRMQTAYGNRAVAYYLGEDDFYACDGLNSQPIGAQKIARTFFADLDPAYLSMVQGGFVPNLPVAFWLYNSAGGSGMGLYDRLLIYNTLLARWSLVDLSATPAEWGTRAMAPGFTLDGLDVFGALDTLPAPLDSGNWTAGTPTLAAFDKNHKLNFVNGPPMAPVVETSEFQPTQGRRSKIISARPLIDGGAPSVSIGVRDRLVDAVSYGAAIAMNSIGECPQRVTGRYARAQLTLPAGSVFSQLQGVEFDVKPEGRR